MKIELQKIDWNETNIDLCYAKSIELHVVDSNGEDYYEVSIGIFSSDFETFVSVYKDDFKEFSDYLEECEDVEEYYFALTAEGYYKKLTLLGIGDDNFIYFEIVDED